MSTPRLRRALGLLVAALVVLGVAALVVRAFEHRVAPKSPEQLVPTVWQSARDTPMHRAHLEKRVACRECHGDANATRDLLDFETTDAGPPVTEAVCAKCHEGEQHRGHVRTASPKDPAKLPTCLSCHVFGANKTQARCLDCHDRGHRAENAPALEHHASGDIACNACHTVHGKDRTVLADCTTCHAEVAAKHGNLAATGAVFCTDCHAPHAGKEAARSSCESCHVGRAQHLRDARVPQIAIARRGEGVAGHAACLTCHAPHDARRADVKPCAGCHADHAEATKNPGHGTCTGCHTPHAPADGTKASCSTACHSAVKALAADRVPAHADCTSCHRPHEAAASAPPAEACVHCHEEQRTALSHGSAHGKTPSCTSCHAPHDAPREPRRPTKSPALCASCHAGESTLVAGVRGHADCESCHGTAHAPKPTPTCESCHAAEQHSAPLGHQRCTSCHEPHSGARKPAAATCASCHEAKAKAQHGSIAGGCQNCHRPHGPNGPATPPACSTCHAQPTLQGLHGKAGHATCGSCHTAHGAVRADRATCTSCHQDRARHQPDARACNGCHLFRQ